MFGIASARQGRSHQRKLGRWRNGLWFPKLYTDTCAGLRVLCTLRATYVILISVVYVV